MLSKQPSEMQQKILDAVTEGARKYADSSGVVHMENEAICIACHV